MPSLLWLRFSEPFLAGVSPQARSVTWSEAIGAVEACALVTKRNVGTLVAAGI